MAKVMLVAAVCLAVWLGLLAPPDASHLQPLRPGDAARSDLRWMSEPWNGDEKPFQRVRGAIEAAVAKGRAPEDLLVRYRNVALRAPTDALAQYGWACAAYHAASRDGADPLFGRHPALDGVFPALAAVRSPHTYEFDRIRFLILETWSGSYKLASVARRLWRHDPGDPAVAYMAADALVGSRARQDEDLGTSIARDLLKRHPDVAAYHRLVGSASSIAWERRRSRSDLEAAIAEYRAYLRLAPADDPSRETSVSVLKSLERSLTKWFGPK